MTTPTLREALENFNCHFTSVNGVPPNARISVPLEEWQHLYTSLTAQPELPEPVAEITSVDEYGPYLGWHTHWVNYPIGTKLYTASQLQQVVELAQAKREPMTESEIAQDMADGLFFEHPTKIVRAIEAHRSIGGGK